MALQSIVLGRGQSDALAVKGASEFLSGQVTLAEDIVILEELKDSNAVFLYDLFDLLHEFEVTIDSVKVYESVSEGGLGARGIAIDHILKAVGITEELRVLD